MQLSYTAVQKHFGELVILWAGEKWKSWTIARYVWDDSRQTGENGAK